MSKNWKGWVAIFFLVSVIMYAANNKQGSALSPPLSCRTYDDFSSGSLNAVIWDESNTFHGTPFTDEHFVNREEGAYHIQEKIEEDRETNLAPRRQFVAGESFSYKVIVQNGSGNHASQPLINGNYPPTQLEQCDYAGCGVIGYWNGLGDLGDEVGTYNIKYEFFPNQVKMTAVRPNGAVVINTFTGNSQPYTLTINTHTGHNGKLHFDYDDAVICDNRSLPFKTP